MRKRYVSFTLGPGRYCVPVDQVVQILRPENILDVPKAPPFVDGVINLRGDVIPVVNLRARLGIRLHAAAPGPAAGAPGAASGGAPRARIMVTRIGNHSYGLAVDEVSEIVDIDDGGIEREGAETFGLRAGLAFGAVRRESVTYVILDLPRLLSPGRDLPGAERT